MKLFESRLLVEGVRTLEDSAPDLSTYIENSKQKSFEVLLVERAKKLESGLSVSRFFSHFKSITTNFYFVLSLIVFISGGFAVNKFLFSEPLVSVNFFWAFALFFIPNLVMLMVWSLFFFKPRLLQNSSLARFSWATIRHLDNRLNRKLTTNKDYHQLFQCYFNIHFGKQLGRYQLSKLTHLLWLCYFAGATLVTVLMLATHQVDFVWQTSILSADTFQALTQLLAYVPEKLGFATPSIEQIRHSYLGTDTLLDGESRRLAWSSLLISSLLLYGVLPRLCLYLLMVKQLKLKKSAYQLDLSNAYYVQLRQHLKPNKTSLGITDADEEATVPQVENPKNISQLDKDILNKDSYPIAIELSQQQHDLAIEHIKSYNPEKQKQLINACDQQSQQSVLANLKESAETTVVLYVSINRLPDRGLKRFIGEITAVAGKNIQLFLIVENNHNKQRDSDWYQLAKSVGIKLDNILHVEVSGAKYE